MLYTPMEQIKYKFKTDLWLEKYESQSQKNQGHEYLQ